MAIASVSPVAMAEPSGPKSPLRQNLLLTAGSVVFVLVMLGGVELGLRLLGLGAPDQELAGLHAYSEVYGWAPRPGLRLESEGVVTTINEQGYRGEALPTGKTGKRRIVVLGDSIAFGLYVQDAQTFAAVLQSQRRDVEVANLSVQGYGPGQELTKLEREALPLRPDVVVVATCLSNDLADAVLPVFLYDGVHPKPYHRVEDGRLVLYDDHLRLPARDRVALFLRQHSRIVGLFNPPSTAVLEDADGADSGGGWGGRKRAALKDRAGAIDVTSRVLAEMAKQAHAAGADLVVLAFPDRDEWEGVTHWRNALARTPALKDVQVVAMADRFRHLGLSFDDVALDGIGHLTPAGHRATATILTTVLRLPQTSE